MRINEDTLLEGSKVVLVPYTSEHVPRYQHLSHKSHFSFTLLTSVYLLYHINTDVKVMFTVSSV